MATRKPATTKKPVAKKTVAKKTPVKKAPVKKAEPKLRVKANAKDAATKKGEPYVSVISVELDPENVGNGAFELDWNDIFVARLLKAGYEGKTDADVVDRWFQDICRNVVLENFEQWEANQPMESRIRRRDIGDGKTEVS